MSFLVYLFVLVVAACSVVFGLDWMQAPLQPPRYAERPAQAGSPASPAVKPGAPAVAAAVRPATVPQLTSEAAAGTTDGTGDAHAEASQETKTAAPLCDIAACEHAYRSFTPVDCTYQPFEGPRRLCTRGNPPRRHGALLAAADAHAQARCNVSACASAYQSFDAATCTYQPYDGPRRLCTK